jgi:hypothetical protein
MILSHSPILILKHRQTQQRSFNIIYSKTSCEFPRYYYSTITYYTELYRVSRVDGLTTISPHVRVLKNNQEITSMNGTEKKNK